MKLHGLCALLLVVSALVVIAAAPPAAKPEDVGLSSTRLQRIEQLLQRHVAAGNLAGGVAVVGRRDKVAYATAHGVMDLETGQPMAPATMFRIASMTKPIVGAAIMMLVEDGKIRLQDPVSR